MKNNFMPIWRQCVVSLLNMIAVIVVETVNVVAVVVVVNDENFGNFTTMNLLCLFANIEVSLLFLEQ